MAAEFPYRRHRGRNMHLGRIVFVLAVKFEVARGDLVGLASHLPSLLNSKEDCPPEVQGPMRNFELDRVST